MYVSGLEASNKVVRYLIFYSAVALAALFQFHNGNQHSIDKLIRNAKPAVQIFKSPKDNEETLYTKLRNDLIQAEERGCDPANAISTIESQVEHFQVDVAEKLKSL